MPKTNVLAKVKKIDIQNKVLGLNWKQTITLVLGEIELTDANLIAIRKFRPDEEVMVNLSTLQLQLGDLEQSQRDALLDRGTDDTPAPLPEPKPGKPGDEEETLSLEVSDSEDFDGGDFDMRIVEDDEEDDVDPANVLASFSF